MSFKTLRFYPWSLNKNVRSIYHERLLLKTIKLVIHEFEREGSMNRVVSGSTSESTPAAVCLLAEGQRSRFYQYNWSRKDTKMCVVGDTCNSCRSGPKSSFWTAWEDDLAAAVSTIGRRSPSGGNGRRPSLRRHRRPVPPSRARSRQALSCLCFIFTIQDFTTWVYCFSDFSVFWWQAQSRQQR